MRTLDYEMVIVCGIMALVAALAIVVGIVVIAGVRFYQCNPAILSGSFFGISGLLWGILMLTNFDKIIKK